MIHSQEDLSLLISVNNKKMQKSVDKNKPHKLSLFLKTLTNSITQDPAGKICFHFQRLSVEEKIQLVSLIGEEIINPEGLAKVFKNVEYPICYDGFEPSGRMHIA